jgi:hypothetical protein
MVGDLAPQSIIIILRDDTPWQLANTPVVVAWWLASRPLENL